MVQLRRTGRRTGAGGLAGLLAFAVLWLAFGAARADEVLRESLVSPGESKTIQLYADEITTWQQGPQRALLLKGRVWIEQGLTSLRLTESVIWINEEEQQRTGIYTLDVYGEGSQSAPVTIDQGSGQRSADRVLVQLGTRGGIALKSYTNKIQQRNLSAEPSYLRGQEVRKEGIPAEVRTTTLPRPPELMSNSVAAAPLMPASTTARKPAEGPSTDAFTPAPSGIQLAQLPGVPPTAPASPAPPPSMLPPLPPSLADQPPGAPASPPPVEGPPRRLSIQPRSSLDIHSETHLQPNGETAVIISNGFILTITDAKTNKVMLDIEADRAVFWHRGSGNNPFGNMRTPQGETSKQMEFYLSGNVEIRNQTQKETHILRADECYYDVGRNVAVALKGDLEMRSPKSIYPFHFKADELFQLGPKVFEGRRTETFATALPADPGLKIEVREARIEELDTPRTNIFGRQFYDLKTGQPVTTPQRIFEGKGATIRLEGVPIFYSPFIRTDAEDPLGPLEGIGFNYSRIFGFQLMSTWNMFDLLGLAPSPGLRWQLLVDYMSARGPALGTNFKAAGKDLFGFENRYESLVKLYGIYDTGEDQLGGGRGTQAYTSPTTFVPVTHPDWRGRALAKLNLFEMPGGFTFQGQVSAISDRNFLEQFFNQEWNRELNQETFAYLKQQQDHWAWTLLAEPRIREWITETEWLPKAEGNLLGLKLGDYFTYNLRSSAGYARLQPANTIPPPFDPNDKQTDTGRFDVIQDISLPFALGPVKLAPYAVLDLAYYTQDLSGDDRGRVYGGGGVRANMPLSKLYPDIQSEMFNVNGIFHKIVFSGNYYNAQSTTHIYQLPQLDRLNDDPSDQALRDIYPRQTQLNPANGAFLTTSQLFDPQIYALRRLVDTRVDTLDTMEVLQLGVRQRWQTKRGFIGSEHVVDWMTLDLQGSIFPHSNRDNFGDVLGILQYDWTWNIGDRTALVSNGWMETIDNGPRVFNIGTVLSRPDRTNVYLGYRQIDPLNSRAVVASLTYAFSAKYAMTGSTLYDFGVHNQTNTLILSRIGTDLRISFGLSYNTILNNFGVIFEIVPNLLPGAGRASTLAGGGPMGGGPGSMPGSGMGSGNSFGASR